jgi:type II secretory pathway pseudopilin PulG
MTRARCGLSANNRRGFTTVEAVVALGILGMLSLLLAQVACQVVNERRHNLARQTALEAAANVLEAARACPWDDLKPAWAARQRLPESVARCLRDGALVVRVEPEARHALTRRITVEVTWRQDNGKPAPSVQLVGLRSARTAPGTGGTP